MLSIIPFDRVTSQSTPERPFKAYPRGPLPSSASALGYGPFTPPTFVGSISIPAAHTKRSSELVSSAAAAAAAMDLRPQLHHTQPHHPGHDSLPHLMDISQHMPSTRHLPPPPHAPHSSNIIKTEPDSSLHCDLLPQQPTHHQVQSQYAPHPHAGQNGGGQGSPGLDSSSKSPHSAAESTNSEESGDGGYNGEGGNFKVPPKKRPHQVPENLKDLHYWDKRKKNNESAKRSRDARRMKEEQIAMRVVYLEQENLQLRTEVSLLKSEIEKLRCMLYNS